MIKLNLNGKAATQAHIVQHLTDASRAVLAKRAVEHVQPFWQMTIGQLIDFAAGDFTSVVSDVKKMTLAQFVWLGEFPKWLEEFSRAVGNLQVPTTAEQRQAANACLPVEWREGLLVFARRYFALPSFAAAEGVKVCDFVLAKKDEYNAAAFERAMSEQRRRAWKNARK